MANKVSLNDIKNMNELYLKFKTYAEVARQTGFSPSTVRKYIQKDYVSQNDIQMIKFNLEKDLPKFDGSKFENLDNFGELCVLSEEEKLEIKDLTTGRIYSTELAKELKTDKFNSIVTHGYTIKDNGNGIVDENDTIEGNDLNELKTLGQFLKEAGYV